MAASPPVSDTRALPAELPARMLVVMGVSGAGKTTVARALAAYLDADFLEGDDYHPPENTRKMANGIALTDDDRWPWLTHFSRAMSEAQGPVVGACSALKRRYREHIQNVAGEHVVFVFLDGSPDLVFERISGRSDHFMPSGLLESQYASLQPPEPDEPAIRISIHNTADAVARDAVARLTRLARRQRQVSTA